MYSLSTVVSTPEFTLPASTEESTSNLQFILVYGMLESAGNTYQTEGYTADIIVTATQTNTTKDTVVYAYKASDITGLTDADTNKTVILMDNITVDGDIDLKFNVNFDLNGYTLAADSFSMYTDDYCTVDIANGYIVVTEGNFVINIPNGTINRSNYDTFISSNGKVYLTASPNTITESGELGIYEIISTSSLLECLADGSWTAEEVKAWVGTTDPVTVGEKVISAGTKVIVNEDAVVTENFSAENGDYYILILNGTVNGTISGATTEDEVEEGTEVIFTAQQLYDFMTSTDSDDDKAILGCNITYDTDTYDVMYVYSTKDLDLAGYTITVPNDVTDKDRPINLKSGADLTIYGGTFIAGTYTDDTTKTNGSYGAIQLYSSTNTSLYVHDMVFYNAHEGALCLKLTYGGTVVINDCIFYSSFGGAIDCACSSMNITNCTVVQQGMSTNAWASTAISTCYGDTTNVHSGSYANVGYGAYVYSSGGTLNIYGGDWQASTAVIKADSSTAGSTINVSGGTFDGAISIANGATLNIYGGTFSNTGLTLTQFSAYVPTGYTVTETSTGVYTVSESTHK